MKVHEIISESSDLNEGIKDLLSLPKFIEKWGPRLKEIPGKAADTYQMVKDARVWRYIGRLIGENPETEKDYIQVWAKKYAEAIKDFNANQGKYLGKKPTVESVIDRTMRENSNNAVGFESLDTALKDSDLLERIESEANAILKNERLATKTAEAERKAKEEADKKAKDAADKQARKDKEAERKHELDKIKAGQSNGNVEKSPTLKKSGPIKWVAVTFGWNLIPLLANIDASWGQPYLEYRENMLKIKKWVDLRHSNPPGPRPKDVNGNFLDDDDNGVQLSDDAFLTKMNDIYAQAAYIKFASIVEKTFFENQIIQGIGHNLGITGVGLGALALAAKFIPGAPSFIFRGATPIFLSYYAFLAYQNGADLQGRSPEYLEAIASGIHLAITQDIVHDYIELPLDKIKEDWGTLITIANAAQKAVTGDPAGTKIGKQVDAAQKPGYVPPAKPEEEEPKVGPSGNPVYENRASWVRNLAGTKVRNPRTGLWESYQR